MTRLWDKGEGLDALVAAFTVGDDPEMDARWAWHDVVGSAAHVRTQAAAGLLTATEASQLLAGLATILDDVEAGRFVIAPEDEDVHTAVESLLTARLGAVAGKLHTGRSRNDQVLTDLRMWMKERLGAVEEELQALIVALLAFGERHADLPLTGYTHLQRAMPSSYGQWAGGYAAALIDLGPLFDAAWALADRCPLGSAAGYGTPLPLDRGLSAKLLGFGAVEGPETTSQLTRGIVESAVLGAMGAAMTVVARLAWDVCLYATTEFGLLRLPDALTTGSSIMPQKRNPDVAELLRASAVRVRGARREIEDIVALPGGYHRDLQLTKQPLVRGVETTHQCLAVAARLVEGLEPTAVALDPVLYATAEALRRPKPFREAYRDVAEEVKRGGFVAAPAPAPAVDFVALGARMRAPRDVAGLRGEWRRLVG